MRRRFLYRLTRICVYFTERYKQDITLTPKFALITITFHRLAQFTITAPSIGSQRITTRSPSSWTTVWTIAFEVDLAKAIQDVYL